MMLRDQSTMTEPLKHPTRHICGLTLQDGLKFIGSLLLPLMLGIFTVAITFHQQKVTTEQRTEDRLLAREQRQQDLNMFALQREQDLNISRDQRRQDKDIAEQKQIQDDRLADKQRNLSEAQRTHELNISQQQLGDSLLVTYMNEIGNLLKENDGALTADPLVAIIARVKTLTAIRRLDASRNTHLIQFLYEAKQLTNGNNPLDLSDAELDGIDFSSHLIHHRNLRNLSLVGALLRNSSFSNRDLSNANFSGADLTDAQFYESKLDDVDLSNGIIVRTNFSKTTVMRSRFDRSNMRRTAFLSATVSNATFIESKLSAVIFSGCRCKGVNFVNANLGGADFSKAFLRGSLFTGAKLQRATFFGADLGVINFKNVQLTEANFTKSRCKGSIFTGAQLMAAIFIQAIAQNMDFTGATMDNVDFSAADLMLSTLSNTKLNNAKFIGTNVTMANFSFASLAKTNISNEQLLAAASIRGAMLPNGTKIDRDPNMLRNGYADCNQTLFNRDWQVSPPGAMIISAEYNSSKNCIFVNQIDSHAYMSQRMNLSRYVLLISRKRAIIVMKGRVGGNITSIRINNHFDKLISAINITQGLGTFLLRARLYSFEPQVIVEFAGYGWCDDLELIVEAIPLNP